MSTTLRKLHELSHSITALREAGKRIVYAHGVFDLPEVADLGFFKTLRTMGDVVVVTIARDEALGKRMRRPSIPHRLRCELVGALGLVDFIALAPWQSAAKGISLLRPHVMAMRSSLQGEERQPSSAEISSARTVGCTIQSIGESSDGRSAVKPRLSPSSEQNSFVEAFRRKHLVPEILAQIEWLRRLKVLVVGETIIDEYSYCDPMGKSGKEPMLVTRYRSTDIQAGGAVAIANHVAEICGHVELLSCLGTEDTREEFVRKRLRKTVRAEFVYKSDSPTIVKRRYVEAYSLAKMFGVYQINDDPLEGADEAAFLGALGRALDRCDVVIVADYGHGILTSRAIELLSKKARFLALNTQLNAANAGFHTLSKYPRADYICVHEGELRLDARSVRGDVQVLMQDAARRLQASSVMVTRGKKGTLLYHNRQGEAFHSCPSLATSVVERVGAGDAVLSLTAPALAAGLPPDVVGFLGNLVGAQAVAVIGNSSSISKQRLIESVKSMLREEAQGRAIG